MAAIYSKRFMAYNLTVPTEISTGPDEGFLWVVRSIDINTGFEIGEASVAVYVNAYGVDGDLVLSSIQGTETGYAYDRWRGRQVLYYQDALAVSCSNDGPYTVIASGYELAVS